MMLSYHTLFSIELLHEYFNKDIFSDCTIMPSNDTAKYFLGDNLLQRFFTNRLFVLAKDNGGKPYTLLDINRVFRFYINCKNQNLFNYSNLDQRVGKGQFLYFSNLANNKIGTELNLSAAIPQYNAATIYQVGDFTKDGITENIFESTQQGSGHALNETDFWQPRATKRFVSGADVIRQSSNSFRYSFSSPVKKSKATVKGYKVSGTTLVEYDVLIFEQFYPDAVKDILIDLTPLTYGKYKIVLEATTDTDVILNDEVPVYFDVNAVQTGIIGVIEIFSHLDSANDYSLLDNTGVMKQIKYSIRFANRNALWKYITQTTNITDIVTNVAGLSFAKASKIFTSNKPIQLKQIPDNSFVLTFSNSSPPDPVKASYPSPTVMKCEKNPDGTIKNFFTEIYINY
jgi:hypothetical protein